MSKPKITYSDDLNIKFSDIKIGEVFLYSDTLYMRIEFLKVAPGDKSSPVNSVTVTNAIVLSNGRLAYFRDIDDVTPVDAEIKVWR